MLFLPLDPGWVKNQDPDPRSGMNNPNHISESLETILWVKILKFFDADPGCKKNSDPGWKKIGSGIREKHPESATLEKIKKIKTAAKLRTRKSTGENGEKLHQC